MNICSSVSTDDLLGYPVNQRNIANRLLNKGINYVITHNWELSQEAS